MKFQGFGCSIRELPDDLAVEGLIYYLRKQLDYVPEKLEWSLRPRSL